MAAPEQDSGGPNAHSRASAGRADSLKQFEQLVAHLAKPNYVFCLYVSGNTPRSAQAVDSIRRICDQYLSGRYELKVVDIYQQPSEAKRRKVVAVPTLIKELPLPAQTFIGDMSKTERIVIGLNLEHKV